MVVEIIRYEIAPELAESFKQAYKEAGAYLNRSKHCLSYEITNGIENLIISLSESNGTR